MAFLFVGMGLVVGFISTIASHIRRHSVLHGAFSRLAARHHAHRPAPEVGPATTIPELGEYDLLVIGSDEGSRRTALEAAQAGLRVVVLPGNGATSVSAATRSAA